MVEVKCNNSASSHVNADDFRRLYETAFPGVARFVSRHGGRLDDAKDIFHDAVIIYYEKSRDDSFRITSSETAYLLGIAKHRWIRKYAKDRDTVALDSFEKTIAMPDDYDSGIIPERLLSWLQRAGQKCMELLLAFYYDKLPMTKIREKFGYGSAQSATNQKYKCLEKIRAEVRSRSVSYEDFTE